MHYYFYKSQKNLPFFYYFLKIRTATLTNILRIDFIFTTASSATPIIHMSYILLIQLWDC